MEAGPFQTIDISGMGGGYEDGCQRMLWRGVQYLAERKPPTAMWEGAKQNPQIVGVLLTEGDELKKLEQYILDGCSGASGAMHQAVMNHLAYIHQHGTEGWLKEAKRRDSERLREWGGDLEDPDKTPQGT